MKIELGKDDQYQTRDGRKVRIHAVDIDGEWPVLYSVLFAGRWRTKAATKEGFWRLAEVPHELDIVPSPVVRELWVNVYPEAGDCIVHANKDIADVRGTHRRIATLHVSFRDIDAKNGVIELRSWRDDA